MLVVMAISVYTMRVQRFLPRVTLCPLWLRILGPSLGTSLLDLRYVTHYDET